MITKHASILCSAYFLTATCLYGQVRVFELDKSHSYIEFSIDYLEMMTQKGEFTDFDVAVSYDYDNPDDLSATITIQSASINTNHSFRDKHLKSPDFLDVENYPMIQFSGLRTEKNEYIMTGDLALHGVTKEIQVPYKSTGIVVDWQGRDRMGFEGEFSISRKDFDILGGNKFNPRFVKDRVIGDDVKITFSIQVYIRNSTDWKPALDVLKLIEGAGFEEAFSRFKATINENPDDPSMIAWLTATEPLMYRPAKEARDRAIQVLQYLSQIPNQNERLYSSVDQKLLICYFLSNDSRLIEYLQSNNSQSPIIKEVRRRIK